MPSSWNVVTFPSPIKWLKYWQGLQCFSTVTEQENFIKFYFYVTSMEFSMYFALGHRCERCLNSRLERWDPYWKASHFHIHSLRLDILNIPACS
jgi:hypothetical protein